MADLFIMRGGTSIYGVILSLGLSACGTSPSGSSSAALNLTPSPSTTLYTIDERVPADGVSRATIRVVFKNADGQVLPGQSMRVNVSGQDNNLSFCPPSDANGLSVCYLTSTFAETKYLTISGAFEIHESVVFFRPPPNHLMAAIVSGGTTFGKRLTASSGITQTPNRLRDNQGVLRAQTSFQGQVWAH